ncbi:class I SAM-dependent methyltransferase [Planococcus shixiaomingii]|uniref:class I SAM-dependent methyltransferase n=1 Tax=Planococcus shixiaomingii TaxID=3058393 RepID=UPI0026383917|nr:class I SAM-dependent methyltransferase [Planococcus sp. N022]WKA56465.1 class I SAM-dependent methyltransferase [Planococcus sp. N022]
MHNEHKNHQGSKHHHGKVSYLESAKRREELSPEKLLSLIPLKATDRILDFGAGTGYFSIPAAKLVNGPVYAMDIDESMLEIIALKAQQQHITNIVPIHGSDAELLLPEASIDVAIASLVLHEIEPLAPVLNQIKKVLKDGGSLVCIELEPKGQPSHKAPRITLAGMERALVDAGMRITQKHFPTDSLYVLIAQK